MEAKEKIVVEFDEEKVQEHYADAFNIETGFYGSTLLFGVSRRERKPLALAKIRLSP